MQFDLFRISMALRTQIDIDEFRKADGSIPSREEWLRKIFSERIQFSVRGQNYYFLPIFDGDKLGSIQGRIGRQTVEKENAPPEQGFADIERLQWHASIIAIDPTHHEDGQQLAMEVKSSVGSTYALLDGITKYLNETKYNSPYIIEIGAIIDPSTFWDFVRENEGNVTALTLEAPVPNMFGHESDFDKDFREYRDKEKAQKVALTLKSQDGLNLDTPTIRSGVNYTAKSGGKITARAKKKKSYNSKKKTKRVDSSTFTDKIGGQIIKIYAIIKSTIEGLTLK